MPIMAYLGDLCRPLFGKDPRMMILARFFLSKQRNPIKVSSPPEFGIFHKNSISTFLMGIWRSPPPNFEVHFG